MEAMMAVISFLVLYIAFRAILTKTNIFVYTFYVSKNQLLSTHNHIHHVHDSITHYSNLVPKMSSGARLKSSTLILIKS